MSFISAPGPPKVEFPEVKKPTSSFGYSCQVYLALKVANEVFGVSVPWLWFSRQFDPVDNVDSSNPAQIYLLLSRAVQARDIGSKIIRGYKASLIDTVIKHVVDPSDSASLQNIINGASIDYFRPQVWLLNLEAIAKKKYTNVDAVLDECRENAKDEVGKNIGQTLQLDEYLIKDLKNGDYAVVIEG